MYLFSIILFGFISMTVAIRCSIAISNEDIDKDCNWLVFVFSIIGTAFLTLGAVTLSNLENPTALDVYQGKTTLRITYENEVAIDSIVVFKENKEK